MPKLTGATYVTNPSGEPVLLKEGDELPDWADMVGDHLLDEPRPVKRKRSPRRPKSKDADEQPTGSDDTSGEDRSGDDEEPDTIESLVDENSKDELLALADEAGAEVNGSASKAEIAEAILTARADLDDSSDDE